MRVSHTPLSTPASCIRVVARLLTVMVLAAYLAGCGGGNVPPPLPEQDPHHQNVFYGAVPPDIGYNAPVLLFVHGLGGTADKWWVGNDMYDTAYDAGYRTAFISLSPDNTPNNASIKDNAAVLTELLPEIAFHFQVENMYVIGHSKGGVDIQAAMLDPRIAALVKAVFTISSPNQGTELANWALEHPILAGQLGLNTPAVASMHTVSMATFRHVADPILKSYGIPFYTMGGSKFLGDPLTSIGGLILLSLAPPGPHFDNPNDGLVTAARARLPRDYSVDLASVPTHHFDTDTGSVSFHRIDAIIDGLESSFNEFERIAVDGFSDLGGDSNNLWAWSAKWFKGKLYVGTGREIFCLSVLTADVRTGTKFYPLLALSGQCPDEDILRESISAEIWQYTPSGYKKPYCDDDDDDDHGKRHRDDDHGKRHSYDDDDDHGKRHRDDDDDDHGKRHCDDDDDDHGKRHSDDDDDDDGDHQKGQWKRVFKSPNNVPVKDANGTVVGLTARDVGFRGMTVFVEPDGTEVLYAGGVNSGSVYEPSPFEPDGWPAPRLLRSVDGEHWEPVPQDPGTYLGEIGNLLLAPNTKVRTFRSLASYKGMLFATVGDFVGSGVIIASANPSAGNDTWFQVSPQRDEFPVWAIRPFNGYLYVTTGFTSQQDPEKRGYGVYKTDAEGDPPYEFIPVVTDGGYQTDDRTRAPNGLSLAEFQGALYVGTNRPTELIRVHPDDTWDLIVGEPRLTPQGFKAPLSGFTNGFANRFNGHFWRMASHDGNLYLGTWDWSTMFLWATDIAEIPDKLFAGAYGFNLFRTDDGVHWTSLSQSGMNDPNNTGVRSLESTPSGLFMGTARQRYGMQVFRSDGPSDPGPLPPPGYLRAKSKLLAGNTAMLSWEPTPGAVRYRVYRATGPLLEDLAPLQTATQSDDTEESDGIDIDELIAACKESSSDIIECSLIEDFLASPTPQAKKGAGYLRGFELVGITYTNSYSEPAPSQLQSVYYVQAEGAYGGLSRPSNVVGAPSLAPLLPPLITVSITPEPNPAGWNNSDVTVKWTVIDTTGTGIISTNGCETVTLTEETPGTVLTCSATNGLGLSASKSVVIRIDKTAPEVVLQFDPDHFDLSVYRRDTLTIIPPDTVTPLGGHKERRTYTVSDISGTELVLTVFVKLAGKEIKAEVETLQYNDTEVIIRPSNDLKFEWSVEKNGTLKKLNQKIRVDKGKLKEELKAKYDSKKDETIVKLGAHKEKLVLPGLYLLQLETANGELHIVYP